MSWLVGFSPSEKLGWWLTMTRNWLGLLVFFLATTVLHSFLAPFFVVAQVGGEASTPSASLVLDYDVLHTTPPQPINPGTPATIFFSIRNVGGLAAEDVEACLFGVPPLLVEQCWHLESLPPGGFASFSAGFHVDSHASAGVHVMLLVLGYEKLFLDGEVVGRSFEEVWWSVPVRVAGETRLRVLSVRGELEPGGSNKVVVTLENSGVNLVRGLEVRVVPGRIPRLVAGVGSEATAQFVPTVYEEEVIIPVVGHALVGSLHPGERVETVFTLYAKEGLPGGVYPASLQMVFEDEAGNPGEERVSIGVRVVSAVRRPRLVVVGGDSGSKGFISGFEPGETIEMGFKVRNVGEKTAKHVELVVEPVGVVSGAQAGESGFLFVVGRRTSYLGDIPPGEVKEAVFRVRAGVDAPSGVYQVSLRFVYYDDRGERFVGEDVIGLEVVGEARLVVSLEGAENVCPGCRASARVSVANRGNDEARYLMLRFSGVGGLAPREQFVGTLEPDDFDTVEFSFRVPGAAGVEDVLTLRVELEYTDSENRVVSEEKTLHVEVSEKKTKGRSVFVYLLVLIFLVFFIYFLRVWRRGKMA